MKRVFLNINQSTTNDRGVCQKTHELHKRHDIYHCRLRIQNEVLQMVYGAHKSDKAIEIVTHLLGGAKRQLALQCYCHDTPHLKIDNTKNEQYGVCDVI